MKIRMPDAISVYAEHGSEKFAVCGPERCYGAMFKLDDIIVRVEKAGENLCVKAAAKTSALRYLRCRWNFAEGERRNEAVKVLGDEWERGYGCMEWRGIAPERCMPWVCMVSNGSDADAEMTGRFTECFGVKVRPGALCFWQYDQDGVTLWMDVRNGGSGVLLDGRELDVCEIVFGEARDISAFRAIRAYYATLCDDMIVADHKVYGSNNWYYAYGVSSHEEILADTKLVADLCAGLENRPYMVIDDGWHPNRTDGPWHCGNERFPDMKGLADGMKALNVRPGLWVRYLRDSKHETPGLPADARLMRDDEFLDPTHPAVVELIKRDTRRFVEEWGYQLIKHDFSTYDIFGGWGKDRPQALTDDGWHFYDRSRTSAEIVVDFYRTIREAAGKSTVIIGCNVIGHLTAGLAQLNRTGDDTSGREWERTRKFGVNTLAFRMMHDKTFYAADADCVGIMGPVPWTLNREWARALACSGTPLFVSCKPGILSEAELAEMRDFYARSSVQDDVLEPLDWMETVCPARWLLNGEEIRFSWIPEGGVEAFKP